MKNVVALMVALLLLFPVIAYAQETTITPDATITPDTTETMETTPTPEGEVKVIPIFNYQIVIVMGKEGVSVSLFKVEDGVEEEVVSYNFEGAMGKVVSLVARTVPAGSEHGKVVSEYVKEINRQKRIQKEEERIEKRERKREEKEAREESREMKKDLQETGEKDKDKKGQGKEKKNNSGKKEKVKDKRDILLSED